MAGNVVGAHWSSHTSWSVSVCECGVGDKAVSGEEHS